MRTFATTHIQSLIRNGLAIAEAVDGVRWDSTVDCSPFLHSDVQPERHATFALDKAIADLRHAADELDAERLSCLGWRQV